MPNIVIDKLKPKTVEVELPTYEGSVVTMLCAVPLDMSRQLQEKFPNAQKNPIEGYNAGIATILQVIKKWNLAEDVDGVEKVFDINEDNIVQLLTDKDIQLLGAVLQGEAEHIEGTKWRLKTKEEKKI